MSLLKTTLLRVSLLVVSHDSNTGSMLIVLDKVYEHTCGVLAMIQWQYLIVVVAVIVVLAVVVVVVLLVLVVRRSSSGSSSSIRSDVFPDRSSGLQRTPLEIDARHNIS